MVLFIIFSAKSLEGSERAATPLMSPLKNSLMEWGCSRSFPEKRSQLLSAQKGSPGNVTGSGYPGNSSTGDGLSNILLTKGKSGNQNKQVRFSNMHVIHP